MAILLDGHSVRKPEGRDLARTIPPSLGPLRAVLSHSSLFVRLMMRIPSLCSKVLSASFHEYKREVTGNVRIVK